LGEVGVGGGFCKELEAVSPGARALAESAPLREGPEEAQVLHLRER